ncbi:MAG: cell division protein FtsA, partial [Pseudomonadota bacterium]
IPQEFLIDKQDGIREPQGMSGVRLESKVHIVTASTSAVQNIIKCADRTNLHVEEIVLQQIASAGSVLSDDEKELGVILVDIGGGTTDIAIFSKGSLAYTGVIPLGGDQVTNDIAIGLRTPTSDAEKIKVNHGCALASMIQKDETIEVSSVGGRKDRLVSRNILSEIIQARMEEIFSLVRDEVVRAGFEGRCASGLVVSGGTSEMTGLAELGEQIFDLPIRKGIPDKIAGGLKDMVKKPTFATGVGLVQYGVERVKSDRTAYFRKNKSGKKVTSRFRSFIEDMF